jgi:hypothetical protein
MPCNGLIYAPQHPCACYIEAKLYGFTALAPPSPTMRTRRQVPDRERLMRGPAYSQIANRESQIENPFDWPTFRHDTERSGTVKTTIRPTDLKRTWGTNLGGKLSAPVVADGRLFVASEDAHCVHALDAVTGKHLWSFCRRRQARVAVSRRAGGPADGGLRATRVRMARARQRACTQRPFDRLRAGSALLRRGPLNVSRRRT